MFVYICVSTFHALSVQNITLIVFFNFFCAFHVFIKVNANEVMLQTTDEHVFIEVNANEVMLQTTDEVVG